MTSPARVLVDAARPANIARSEPMVKMATVSSDNGHVSRGQFSRVVAEISRTSEFFSVAELSAQTGQPASNFASVVVKELLDNALDAAETSGRAPEVSLEAIKKNGSVRISVSDNGAGIKPEIVDRIMNFDVRVSDKVNYRAPSRGQQGNALKTILGMPYALCSSEPVTIISQGVKHTIYAQPDPLGAIQIRHEKEDVTNTTGTNIALTLPQNPAANQFDPIWLVEAYALANPHALVKISYFNEDDQNSYLVNSANEKISEIYQPSVEIGKAWRKFMPGDLTSPAWYDADTLKRQIFTHIKTGTNPTLREFVKQFRGLSANVKAKAVCDSFPEIRRLSDFETQPNLISNLLDEMKKTAEPPSSGAMGAIGREHIRLIFSERFGIEGDRFWYKRLQGETNGIPYVIEAAAAEVETDPGALFYALNFSPTFEDPVANTPLITEKFTAYGFNNFMEECYANPAGSTWSIRSNVAVALHIVCPAPEFLDRGKTRICLPSEIASLVAQALWSVGKVFFKEGKQREKDAAAQERRDEERRRVKNSTDENLKEAVFKVLPDVYQEVTAGERYPISVKDFHYAVRPKIQAYTSKELRHDYFSQNIIVEYQRQYGKFKQLYYDPRGYLYEPHTGNKTLIGTREVENYEFPSWLYNKILYVEKKGFVEPFLVAKIAERYDMAIVAAEGYATEALRNLFQNADKETDYRLFVLHDSDPYGYNIARTLREETKRMPGYHVDVIDLGLKLDEALEMGLQTEDFSRRKAIPHGLKLTPLEKEYFTGEEIGKNIWKAKRVELNAMAPAQRIAYLERKLAEHGATAKVLPTEEVLEEHALAAFEIKARDAVRSKIESILDINGRVERILDSFSSPDLSDEICDVKEALNCNPPESWKDLIEESAAKRAAEIVEGLAWEKLLV